MKKFAAPLLLAALVAGALYLTRSLESPQVSTGPVGPGDGVQADQHPDEGSGALEPGSSSDLREVLEARAEVDGRVAPDPVEPEVGSLSVRVRDSHGAPSPGVFVLAATDRDHPLGRRRFLEATDAEGKVVFDPMAPGTHWVRTDRGTYDERVSVEVLPGAVAEVELELPAGLRVHGIVLDPGERPVPGAEVWMSTRGSSWAAGVPVTETDDGGRFEVFDVRAGASLGARADGYRRSSLVDLDKVDCSTGSAELSLRLHPGSAALEGRVTDSGGVGIEGARIAFGDARAYEEHRSDDTIEEVWAVPSTRTDAEGRYVLDSLPPGREPVRVRAEGFAIETTEVELEAGQRRTLDFRLGTGGILEGLVTDAGGIAVPRARIQAFEDQLDEDFLQGGQVDYYGAFGTASTVTDEEGRYRLTGIPVGDAHVYALTPRPASGRQLGTVYPFVRRTFHLAHGEVRTWDPVLEDGPSIHGTVSYRDGTPLTNTFISLEGQALDGTPTRRAMYTVDGTFRFIQLPDQTYDLRVQVWNLPEGATEPRAQGIRPGGPPLELIADFDAPKTLETGHVVVTIEAEELPGSGGIVAQMQRDDRSSWRIGEERDDRWHFDLDPEYRYRLLVLRGEHPIYLGEPVGVEPGSELDLGTVRPEELGTLVVGYRSPDGLDPSEAKLWVSHADGGSGESYPLDPSAEITVPGVLPGTWRLSVHGHYVTRLSEEATVVAGKTTRVVLELTSAVPVPYTITREASEPAIAMSIRFTDQRDGSEIHAFTTKDMSRYSNPIRWTLPLPPGGYALEVERGDGTFERREFTVSSLDPDDAPSLEVNFD